MVRDAVATYDEAPIRTTEVPREAGELGRSASVVLASSQVRSIRTAELLAEGRQVVSDCIYDEAALPCPRGTIPLLPARVWFIVLRVLWLVGWAGGAESKSRVKVRARVAAERLVGAAERGGLVVLVGHGIFMGFIAQALEGMGWRRLGPIPRRPWSACCFVAPGNEAREP
jgi:broad specificity phosphatase PhoE